jgi:tRNA-modifying protein YgfZ
MSAVPAPESGPDAGAAWHYGDPLGEQRAAADDAVAVDRSHRVVIELRGSERKSWLHNISTQHVSALPDGTVTENLSLDGQGRVEDHWIQTELGDVTYLDTEAWRGEPLLGYLRKMIFWSDVAIEQADLAVLSLLGPGLAEDRVLALLGLTSLPAEHTAQALPGGGFVRRLGGPDGQLDLVVPRAQAAEWLDRLTAAGVRRAGVWAYEAHRVTAMRPRLGVDTDERTIPHEVNWVGSAAHVAKGCYRGQETVSKVHNIGRPPRRMLLLHLDGSPEVLPQTGDEVRSGERVVGRLGTVAQHHELGPIALALVKRSVTAETTLTAGSEDRVVDAAIDPDSIPPDTPGAGRAAARGLHG